MVNQTKLALRRRKSKLFIRVSLAATILCAGIIAPMAAAQMPALLPKKETVSPTQATPVDGIYTISTLGKRIQIDRGRGYMLDPWIQALLWEVQTDMVTLKNFRRTGVGTYEAFDLPMNTKVKFTMDPQGVLNGVVKGVKYKLIPISAANPKSFTRELLAVRKLETIKPIPKPGPISEPKPTPKPEPVASAPVKQYLIYVRHAWCTGKKSWMTGSMSGNILLSIDSPNGQTLETKSFTIAGKCKKKNYKKNTYSYSRTDPKLLSIKTPDIKQFRNLRIIGTYQMAGQSVGWRPRTKNIHGVIKNLNRPMKIDETVDTHFSVLGNEPGLYLNVRIKRVK